MQLGLFPPALKLPQGLSYQEGFLSPEEEKSLLKEFQNISFGQFAMHGVVARRRVKLFGDAFSRDTGEYHRHIEMPDFLLALRERIATCAQVAPETFRMVLVTEYPPGAPIGWHRDAPHYGFVVGISLGNTATMRLRPQNGLPQDILRLELAPGSLYILRDQARYFWEHSILPVKQLRYAITFRTIL